MLSHTNMFKQFINAPELTKRGVGSVRYAKKIKAKRIQLSTAIDNFIGQSLYESLGYVKDIDFYTYDFEIK